MCRGMLVGSVPMGKAGTAVMICTQCLPAVLCRQGWARPGEELIHCSSHFGLSGCLHPHFPSLLTTVQHVVPAAMAAQK